MNIFVSGGCKNGKSMYAQNIAKEMAKELNVPLYYIATMIPKGSEDDKRIHRHKNERDGWGFITIEQGKNILNCLDRVDPNGVFLFDSVTALLENEMFNEDFSFDKEARQRVKDDLLQFAMSTGNTVFVSDFIYSDALEFFDLTEHYREALAYCDKALAEICSKVVEVSYNMKYEYKEGKFLKSE